MFSVFAETLSDKADVMSAGRLFLSFGPTEANDCSPVVTRHERQTGSWLEVHDCS